MRRKKEKIEQKKEMEKKGIREERARKGRTLEKRSLTVNSVHKCIITTNLFIVLYIQ